MNSRQKVLVIIQGKMPDILTIFELYVDKDVEKNS